MIKPGVFVPQYKGKDLDKVPESKLKGNYWAGPKLDGNYVQIHKGVNFVVFFTSGGKEFRLLDLESEMLRLFGTIEFIIENEFISDTDGLLGSRGQCTTTTWRTNYEKNIVSNCGDKQFRSFDILYINGVDLRKEKYLKRLAHLSSIPDINNIKQVKFTPVSLENAKKMTQDYCNEGGEGYFLFHSDHIIEEKGRSNLAIKLKAKPTADLLCVGVKYSEINSEDIGSLELVDGKGLKVFAGGLSHDLKGKDPSFFINRIVEITYESMGVNTYQQPRFKGFRDDKQTID